MSIGRFFFVLAQLLFQLVNNRVDDSHQLFACFRGHKGPGFLGSDIDFQARPLLILQIHGDFCQRETIMESRQLHHLFVELGLFLRTNVSLLFGDS